ncbi:MAG: N-acetyltransferase [Elusimicrobia bacterium]|nr:N-acetyltransferase [Elusimicrobiota bacterium]
MAGSEPWLTLRRGCRSALAILLDPSREVHVAAAGGRPVGFIIIAMTGPFRGYIQTIAVDPAHRGSGVGGRLISFAERRIFAESPNVFLCVSSFNHRARKLYERLDYKVVGRLKDYVVRGHSEILMRKTTGPLSGFKPARRASS